MQIIKVSQNNQVAIINQAIKTFAAGGLVIYPTETTYGAGVLATSQHAVNKLLAYKSRREGKPLSIAVVNTKMAEKYVEINDQAKTLYQQFLPGPVTVVSLGKHQLATGVESEFGTLGIRIPNYPLILKIIKKLDQPITATSANSSGKKRPYSITDLLNNLSKKQQNLIDLIIDAGTLAKNPPSIVIDTTLSAPVIIRNNHLWQKKIFGERKDQNLTKLNSKNTDETKAIAGKVGLRQWDNLKKRGLVVGLTGKLGVGKTVFAQGLAEWLGVEERLTSPTYTYVEEYQYLKHQVNGQLYHIDVWKIETPMLAAKLELESLLKPKNLLIIEWFDQIADYFLPIIKRNETKLVLIGLTDSKNNHRQLKISQ